MKSAIQKIHLHPLYTRIYSWSKLLTITGGAQALVQVASLICGILVIHLLPTQEYALYTLANTMLGTMTLLADGGISAGVMSIGGKVWQDPKQLGVILATGLKLRKKFAVISLSVATPILLYLLLYHGASSLAAILITLSLIPAFFAALSDSLLEIAPKLHQDIKQLQKNQIFVGLSRLLLSAMLLFAYPWAFIAIIASGLPRAYGNIRLKKIAEKFIQKQQPDESSEKEILKVVKRVLPASIYFCFTSQINIWLISIFGSTTSIAQLGALGRLGMIINILSTVMNMVIVPRFARLSENKRLLLSRFLQILAILIVSSFLIIFLVRLFPQQILFVLGKQYSGLHEELFLSVTVSCLGLIMGMLYTLSISRGYILSPYINIGVHIVSQTILIIFLDLSTTKGVLFFSIVDYLIITIMFIINLLYYILKLSTT